MSIIRFSDIPGQEEGKRRLRQAVDEWRIPHALLLSGPAGTGKMMLARAFMAYAHCESPVGGEPCGNCRNCRLHAANDHPDVHFSIPIVKNKSRNILVSDDMKEEWHRMLEESPEMSPEKWLQIIEAGNSQPAIHVEEAAEIIRMASFPPFASRIKFFVIWLPERLRLETANKLLKVMEEPGAGICFLLVSDNDLEVLPTIYSRTQRIYLGASAGTGGQEKNSSEEGEFRTFFQTLMRDAYARKVASLKKSSETAAAFGREKIVRLLTYMQGMFRENFIYNLRMPALNHLSDDEERFARNFAPFINAANIEELMDATDAARNDIERNGNAKIVLFDYFLRIIMQIRKSKKI